MRDMKLGNDDPEMDTGPIPKCSHPKFYCSKCQPVKWFPAGDSPVNPGWYITATATIHHRKKGWQVVPRYYDDSDDTWWIYSSHSDNVTLVPNNRFDVWRALPQPPPE